MTCCCAECCAHVLESLLCPASIRPHLWCITGEDSDEEDAAGGGASDGEEEEEGDDVAGAQNDRRASHAQASTRDADIAMTDATDDAGESSRYPRPQQACCVLFMAFKGFAPSPSCTLLPNPAVVVCLFLCSHSQVCPSLLVAVKTDKPVGF